MKLTVCPQPESGFVLVTFANAGSRTLGNFVQTAVRHKFRVTVIGWEPATTKRWPQYYLGSKLTNLLTLLKCCAGRFSPETLVVFSDSDVLVQRDVIDFVESVRASGVLDSQPDKTYRVVYSTELYNTMVAVGC